MSRALPIRTLVRPGRPRPVRPGRAGVLLGLALLVGACASSRTVRRPYPGLPEALPAVRCYGGTPLGGSTIASLQSELPTLLHDERDPAEAWGVEVTWIPIRRAPGGNSRPLASRTRLAVSDPGGEFRFGPPVLLRGARHGRVRSATEFVGRLVEEEPARTPIRQQGVLPAGVTAVFELAAAGEPEGAESALTSGDAAPRQRLAILLHRPLEGSEERGAELSLEAEARPELPLGDEQRVQGGPFPPRHEVVVLADPLRPSLEGLVLGLRSPFRHEGQPEGVWLLAVVRITPAPLLGDTGYAVHRRLYLDCRADVRRAQAHLRPAPPGEQTRLAEPAPDALLGFDPAVRGLSRPEQQRRALLALASHTGAALAHDLALAVDRPLMALLCKLVGKALSQPGVPRAGPELGWLIERTAIGALRERILSQTLPPGVVAALFRYAGAAADRSSFLEMVDAANSLAELRRRLVLENLFLLEDGAVAVRARAHEWLLARGLAPPGYRPLDPEEERQRALEAAPPPDLEPLPPREGP